MNAEILKDLQKKLEESKKQLEEELKSFAEPNKKGDDWNAKFPIEENCDDVECEEDEVEEYDNRLAIEHPLELRLRDINNALEKIKKNAYGKCEICSEKIEEDRLLAIPEARTCTEHK